MSDTFHSSRKSEMSIRSSLRVEEGKGFPGNKTKVLRAEAGKNT